MQVGEKPPVLNRKSPKGVHNIIFVMGLDKWRSL